MKTHVCNAYLICVIITGFSPSSSPSTTKASTSIDKVTLSVPVTQAYLVTLKPSIDYCICVSYLANIVMMIWWARLTSQTGPNKGWGTIVALSSKQEKKRIVERKAVRKEGSKKGRNKGRKKGRKGKNEGSKTSPQNRYSLFFLISIYISFSLSW